MGGFLKQKAVQLWKNCGFLGCFLGTNVRKFMRLIKITIKANQIDMGVLLISKVDNIDNTDKHGTKNLSGLILP